jgi:heptosyltransferase-2
LNSSLVIQTSFLGDVVLTTPLIAHLARSGSVDVVTTPAAAPLLTGHPSVRRLIPYDKRGAGRGPGGLWQLSRRVRAEPDAVAYLAQGSLRSAALATLGGYRERVGFDTSDGRFLYTRRVRYRADQHHAERLLRLAVGNDLSLDAAALRPSLYPSPEDRQVIDQLLSARGAAGERLIALAPGSIWATKRWPGFPALARSLAPHGRIVVLGGASDRSLAAGIVESVASAIDTTGSLSLLASADLIRRAALLVTNDSLPQHLASATGTPTVTIFGPTVPAFGFGPLAPASETVGHMSLACRPCHPHGPASCPLGHHRCMRDLAESDVFTRVRLALGA